MPRLHLMNLTFLIVLTVVILLSTFQFVKALEIDPRFEGKVIDSLVIDNRNIYDTNQPQYDKFLFKTANKFHQATHKRIIRRELLLEKGSKYSEKLADETARVLRQKLILYDAWIEKEIYEEDKLLVRIVTIDRWSFSVGMNIRREGNENEFKFGIKEKNLFGTNRQISYHYISRSQDGNYSDGSYVDNRLFGERLLGHLSFSSNPLDRFTTFLIGRPYYSLVERFGFILSSSYKKGRVDYRTNDSLITQSFYNGDKVDADFYYRFGSYQSKYILKLSYVYLYETNSSDSLLPASIQDTMYHSVKTGVGYSIFDYQKKYNIDGFNFTEDFNNGVELFLQNQKVYSVDDLHSLYNILSFKFRKNIVTPNTLSSFQFIIKNWTNSSGTLRRTRGINIKYYNQEINRINLAWNFDYLFDKSSIHRYDLVTLGGSTGLRGVDKYFLTGDERLVLNSEVRLMPFISIASFNLGMALFADFAHISQSEDNFKLSNMYSSIGAGFRVAFDRSSRNIIRIDFAYNKNNDFSVSFATGQYFQALEQY